MSTPVPEETKSYKPVTHSQLIDLTLESIHKSGFTLDKEYYSSAKDGKIANGRFTVSNVVDSEMQLQIGWQNSYDKSLTLKFAIGTQILICQNGCVSGDYGYFRRKHVGEIQSFTPQAIIDYIKSAGDVFAEIQKQREVMKSIDLSKQTSAELIGRMIIEKEFIQSTQLNTIRREMINPTHNYGAPGSLWELYNFTTFSLKEVHPKFWMENHTAAHTFFTEVAGIISSAKQIISEKKEPYVQLDLFDELYSTENELGEVQG